MNDDKFNLTPIVQRSECIQNNIISWTILRSHQEFNLLIKISSSFEIESTFRASSLEALKKLMNNRISLDKSINNVTIETGCDNKASFDRETDENLWLSLYLSLIEIRSYIDGLIVGQKLSH